VEWQKVNADKHVKIQVCLSDDQTEATTWRTADTDCVANQFDRMVYGITSNEQMRLKNELSIRLIEFEACWTAIGIQEL